MPGSRAWVTFSRPRTLASSIWSQSAGSPALNGAQAVRAAGIVHQHIGGAQSAGRLATAASTAARSRTSNASTCTGTGASSATSSSSRSRRRPGHHQLKARFGQSHGRSPANSRRCAGYKCSVH